MTKNKDKKNKPTNSSTMVDSDSSLLTRRQLHVILALDCSGSMRGDRIASLNYAIRSAIPALRAVAEENPEVQVMVRAVSFNSEAKWHIKEPCSIEKLHWSDLIAGGETSMGAALLLIATALNPDVLTGRQLPAVIILVSDGHPTDDISACLASFFSEKMVRAATRLAIAIGNDSDKKTLERFMASPDTALKPLSANNASDLVHHIKWATMVAVKAITLPTNNPQPLGLLADFSTETTDTDSEFVW